MKKKRRTIYFIIPLICISVLLVGYFGTLARLSPCKGVGWPIPPPSLYFGTYYMVTDQGRLYVGQTYEHRNEGPWVGNLTLLFIDNKGATFLIRSPEGMGSNVKIMKCKIFYPRTPENIAPK
jgi:hypothetical protein